MIDERVTGFDEERFIVHFETGSGPKTMAFYKVVIRRLRRGVVADTPEKRLILAIIEQAITDALTIAAPSMRRERQQEIKKDREDAYRYFKGHLFATHCGYLDIEPATVIRAIKDSKAMIRKQMEVTA